MNRMKNMKNKHENIYQKSLSVRTMVRTSGVSVKTMVRTSRGLEGSVRTMVRTPRGLEGSVRTMDLSSGV